MRIHTDKAERYILTLAASINKDPASLDAWSCVRVHPQAPDEASMATLQAIKEQYMNEECDVILCPDHDVLLISRELNKGELRTIANTITSTFSDPTFEIEAYDLFCDWRLIRTILMAKSLEIKSESPQLTPGLKVDFGEVDSLQGVFLEAKKLRGARHPQYVMVVDDDPLTRRLVASAFKENYALITASDAHEAIANYLLHAPDIVFLDINMPNVNGFAVLRQIIASDPDAYVVMFSGNSYLENVTTALSEGAAGFIAKPFKKEKLHHYIQDSAMHHHKYL